MGNATLFWRLVSCARLNKALLARLVHTVAIREINKRKGTVAGPCQTIGGLGRSNDGFPKRMVGLLKAAENIETYVCRRARRNAIDDK